MPYNQEPDLHRVKGVRTEKWNSDELSDGGSYKKPKVMTMTMTSSSGGGNGEYRKDREEWSDNAIECLLEAYLNKFIELNRGNLRGRDWEEVAAIVSERSEKTRKSVEQCKNKVDNLKKRYKLERHRMVMGSGGTSHWPWFKTMEQIVGNSLPMMKVCLGEESSGCGMSSPVRQSKRYMCLLVSLLGFCICFSSGDMLSIVKILLKNRRDGHIRSSILTFSDLRCVIELACCVF